ncbi:MAG: type IV secretion system DNA-binding domain-containing protein [Patescibacteria group bacterium]|nr:type IV secretion system DNA-binding domain-containing protein [Patescibacteria group bacterium]
MPLSVLIIVLIVLGFGVVFYFVGRIIRKKRILETLQLKLFLVRMPWVSKEGKDLKQEINVTEQLFSALAAFKKPFVFEVAVPYIGEEIHFFIAVQSSLSESFVRQVQSLWNDAEVRAVEDYNIFNYSGVTLGAWLDLKKRFVLPIRTYQEFDADTFSPLLGGFTKINELGEGAALQFIVRPATRAYKKETQVALRFLKKGNRLDYVLRHPLSVSLSDVTAAISPKPKKEEEGYEKLVDEQAVKALELKLSKPFFEVNVRVVSSAPSQSQADSILGSIAAGFSQFSAPERNGFKLVRSRNVKNLVHRFSFREFNSKQAMVLNSEELASIFHFPTPFTDIPKIKELKSKEAPPPSNLPEKGVLIGESVYRGEVKKIRVGNEDRRRHIYIVGQTGTGKSNLLTNMVIDDVSNDKGVAVLDPHGDFTEDILSLIPKKRFKDVIVFNPGDIDRPSGLNIIEYDLKRPEEKTFIVNEMQNMFNKLFAAETMGPMFEQYMRNALLLLMEDSTEEPATLMEVSRVFTDADFRERKLERINNPAVIDFWKKEAVKAGGEASLANMTPYITSKFNNFTANDYMRVIISQTKSAFNFRSVMDEGKILLVNLSKGKIGDINANLLGMIIVGKLLMAALGRVDMPQDERRDFNLYIDEFQNFTTDSIAVILSEARKYRLNLTIAHQFIGQLSEEIRDAVFGNVGSTIAFRVGELDAEFLVKQFKPVFGEQDLVNIDNFNAYVKLLIRGETTKPFNIKTIPAHAGNREVADEIKAISREKYGRNRKEVEEEIYKRLRG